MVLLTTTHLCSSGTYPRCAARSESSATGERRDNAAGGAYQHDNEPDKAQRQHQHCRRANPLHRKHRRRAVRSSGAQRRVDGREGCAPAPARRLSPAAKSCHSPPAAARGALSARKGRFDVPKRTGAPRGARTAAGTARAAHGLKRKGQLRAYHRRAGALSRRRPPPAKAPPRLSVCASPLPRPKTPAGRRAGLRAA